MKHARRRSPDLAETADRSSPGLVNAMNSVERVFTALRHQQPDRVPVVEFVINEKVSPGRRARLP